MGKEEKIRKNSHFRYIYSRGKSYSNSSLIIYITRNGKNINRVGFSVSKKVGNSVVRNRVKINSRELQAE
jgi:ribonuclease P protein component